MVIRRWESSGREKTGSTEHRWVPGERGKSNSAVSFSSVGDRDKAVHSKRKRGTKIKKGRDRTMKITILIRGAREVSITNNAVRGGKGDVKKNNNNVSRCRATTTLNF